MSTIELRAFLDAMVRLGHDGDALLRDVDLSRDQLNDVDARVPCDAFGAIVAGAQRQRFIPNIGLELARVTPLGAYPLLDYLVATSETLGAGIVQLGRYMRLIGNPIQISVHENDEHAEVRVANAAAPFSIEFSVSLMVLHLRAETEDRLVVAHVNVSHTLDDRHAFAHALGCDVRDEASWNGMVIPIDAWRLPLRRRDSMLRRFLEIQADEMLARLPQRNGLAGDVQRALARDLTGGAERIGIVARELAMSGRTLQRRLASEGVSYQQLLDAARQEAAARYLREPTLAISEIAYLVGYSEPAAFHRAFKRWYGVTPEAFRNQSDSKG
jgi:AraC-like DNA-binding protein